MMDALEELFGSPTRAKLLKLFLMTPDGQFSAEEIAKQSRMRGDQFRPELKRLTKLGVLRSMKRHAVAARSGREEVWHANREYPLFTELRALILRSAPHLKGPLLNRLRSVGVMKLAILAGIFIDDSNSRMDLMMVGEGIKKSKLKSFIEWLESEVGRELNYVAMSPVEFRYRMDMYDRFIREVLENPHETLIDKMGVEENHRNNSGG